MFDFSWSRSTATTAAASAPDLPITWSSKIDFDPELLVRLHDAHEHLALSFEALLTAFGAGPDSRALEAAQTCIDQLHDLQRLESMRLYPIISRRLTARTDTMNRFAHERLKVYGLGRRFLRALEDAIGMGREGPIPRPNLMIASAALRRYIAEKETHLYPAYLLCADQTTH